MIFSPVADNHTILAVGVSTGVWEVPSPLLTFELELFELLLVSCELLLFSPEVKLPNEHSVDPPLPVELNTIFPHSSLLWSSILVDCNLFNTSLVGCP